jgi:hypothetical protein
MLFRETVAVYCENHTEHTDTLCGQNAELWYVKAGGTYSNHWALKGSMNCRSIWYDETLRLHTFAWLNSYVGTEDMFRDFTRIVSTEEVEYAHTGVHTYIHTYTGNIP